MVSNIIDFSDYRCLYKNRSKIFYYSLQILDMRKKYEVCICLVVVYVIKIPFFLTVLLTHYWVDEDGYNFGLFKYCVDNTGTCQDVSSKLQTIEGMLGLL